MKVELISIGDELLIGQTVNTNVTWLGQKLSQLGFSVDRAISVKDDENDIRQSIAEAEIRADIIIITGGLGPTKDDITKNVLCAHFDTILVLNEVVLARVKEYFVKRGKEMLEVNEQQAWLPKSAQILDNFQGTASGMMFTRNGKLLISLPGVPYEMQHLMEKQVLPMLQEKFNPQSLQYQTLQFQGIGESYLAERIKDVEDEVRALGFGLAYLPKPGLVRLRISASKEEGNKEKIDAFFKEIGSRLMQYAFSMGEENLEEVVGNLLRSRKQTLATVESCTGGLLASRIVRVPGASDYYQGSLVTYSYDLKHQLVDVPKKLIEELGAVSLEVVEQMAVNGRKKMGVDYCIATSGIAGPDGGTAEKPVGTVCIAIAGPNRIFKQRFLFGTDRERNMEMTALTALNLLRCEILQINIEKS